MKDRVRIENTWWWVCKCTVLTVLVFILFENSKTFLEFEGTLLWERVIITGVAFVILGILAVVKLDFSKRFLRIARPILVVITISTAVLISDEIVNREIASSTIEGVGTFVKIPASIAVSFLTGAVFFFLFYAVFNRMSVAAIITELFMAVFALVVVAVSDFRGIPLLASDLMSIKVAANVAGNYRFTPTFFDFMCLLLIVFHTFLFIQIRGEKGCEGKKTRIVSLVVAMVVAVVFFRGVVFSDFLSQNGIEIEYWKPSNSYKTYGTIPTFMRSVTYTKVERPEGYTTKRIDSIVSRYESDFVSDEMREELPNIIIVINEAFSDLSVLGRFETNRDYMPNFHTLEDNCIKGYYYASSIGGGTANTEFEVLTAGTLGFLNGAIAFEVYIRNNLPALPAMLDNLGYSGCTAFHPCAAENYNRIESYPCLGFKDFISIEDIDYKYKTKHGWMTDRETYKYIITAYEKEDRTKPFFIYDLTMQNHGPYNLGTKFKNAIRITDGNADEEAEEYLNLIEETDKAVAELIDYFEKEQKPTVLLFLGDHQPVLTDSFLKSVTNGESDNWGEEEWMIRYKTPFMIWANFDIEEREVEESSANYLQSIMLQTTGMPLTAYQKYLIELQEKIIWINSVGYKGANGEFYHTYDKESPYYSDAEDYRMLQYNYLFDKRHRKDEFFELK